MNPKVRPAAPANATDHAPTHAVHGSCQLDAPTVAAFCGAVLGWDEETSDRDNICVVCIDLARCPNCGKDFA